MKRIDLPKAAVDLQNRRFGELTCLFPCDVDRRGVRWICRCDCGRLAIRHAAALLRAERAGSMPSCQECNDEARRGYWLAGMTEDARKQRTKNLAEAYRSFGQLYATASIPLPDLPEDRGVQVEATFYGRSRRCWANGYTRIVGRFLCLQCRRFHTEGWGCLDCGEPVCIPCTVAHCCRLNRECSERVALERIQKAMLRQRRDGRDVQIGGAG